MVLTLNDARRRYKTEVAKLLRGRAGKSRGPLLAHRGAVFPIFSHCSRHLSCFCTKLGGSTHQTFITSQFLWLRNPEAAEPGVWGSGSLVRLWAGLQSSETGGAVPSSLAWLRAPRGLPHRAARLRQPASPRATVTQQTGKSLVPL